MLAPHESVVEQIRQELTSTLPTAQSEVIEAGRVRDFLAVLGEDVRSDELQGRQLPPLFLLTLGRTRRPRSARGAVINAGNKFTFRSPVYVGDVLIIRRSVIDVTMRAGSQGRLFLARVGTQYERSEGEIVATAVQTAIYIGR